MKNEFNRILSKKQAEDLSSLFSSYLEMKISYDDILNAVDSFNEVESRIDGRIAGDVEDYLLNYFIRKKAEKLFPDNCSQVEIGVLFGGSFLFTMGAVPGFKGKFIGIDPLDGYYMQDSQRASKIDKYSNVEVSIDTLDLNLNKMGVDPSRYEIIQGYSTDDDVIKKVQNEKISVLFIDGDHSYEGVKKDLEIYSSKLLDGGFVIIDNYNDATWSEVKLYCDELMKDCGIGFSMPFIYGRTLVFRKGGELNAFERASFDSNFNFVEKKLKLENRLHRKIDELEQINSNTKKEINDLKLRLSEYEKQVSILSGYKVDYLLLKHNPLKFIAKKVLR